MSIFKTAFLGAGLALLLGSSAAFAATNAGGTVRTPIVKSENHKDFNGPDTPDTAAAADAEAAAANAAPCDPDDVSCPIQNDGKVGQGVINQGQVSQGSPAYQH